MQNNLSKYWGSDNLLHYRFTDQYGREWDAHTGVMGFSNIEYTDKDGLRHEVHDYGDWWDIWTDTNGNRHEGFERDGRWYERGPNGEFHDAADEILPPYIEESVPLGSGANEDGNQIRVFEDQYGRIWEWGRDAQGNANVGYTDKAGQWHDTYEQDGLWYDTWTDKDGNKHLGQVDQNGNVSDGWTDASGTNHDVVWPAGEDLYGQEARWKKIDNQEQGNEDLDALFLERNDAANLGAEPLPEGGIAPATEEGGVPNPPGDPGEEAAPAPGDDDGGFMGMGEPYVDFIPAIPMVKDPDTGEWRNAEPGEIPGPDGGDAAQSPPNEGVYFTLDLPTERSEIPDASTLDPTAGISLNPQPLPPEPPPNLETLDADTSPPLVDAALLDPEAEGPTLDPNLLDPAAPGPTIDPALVDPNAEGPTIDPALLDPAAPGPTVDPNLLDPNAPGETVDPNTLDPAAPGPTVDPALLDPSLAEWSVPETSVIPDPTLTDPALAETLAQSQGLEDPLIP